MLDNLGIQANGSIVPDPFRAAAATGKVEVIKWILGLMQSAQNDPLEIAFREKTANKQRMKWTLTVAVRAS